MPPRTPPTTERFIELINQFATQNARSFDVDTRAVPYGFTGYGAKGFADFLQTAERTIKSTVNLWIRTAAFRDEPPFYLLSIRSGYVSVLRPDADDPDVIEAQDLSQLGLCSPEVADHVGLDERGTFLAREARRSTPDVRPAMHGQWLATPEALRHFAQQAEQARDEHAAALQRERDEAEALVDSRHGVDLDYIRALLANAGVDTDRLDASAVGEHTLAGFRLKDDEITRLADALCDLGLLPLTREEAATLPKADLPRIAGEQGRGRPSRAAEHAVSAGK